MTRRANPSACRASGSFKSINGATGGACFGGWLSGEVFFGSTLTAGVLPVAGVLVGEFVLLVDVLLGLCVSELLVAALLSGKAGDAVEPLDVDIVPPLCTSMGRTPDSKKIKPITAAIVLIARKDRCM